MHTTFTSLKMFGRNGFLAVFIVALVAAANSESKTSPKPPVSTPVHPGETPYHVSIRYHGRHICSGAIITRRHILTAAHCVNKISGTNDLYAVTGSVKINAGQTHRVYETVYYTRFNPNIPGFRDGLAILVLSSPIAFNQYQNLVKLPNKATVSRTQALVTGWGPGQNGWGSRPDGNLLETDVYTLSANECHSKYDGYVNQYQICSYNHANRGVCQVDGGSPLVSFDDVLVGILSGSPECRPLYPNVYSSVYHYLEWIYSVLNKK